MLSKLPGSSDNQEPQKVSVTDEGPIPDVSDRSYEIGVINSKEADINRFASCKFQENDQLSKPDSFGFDMSTEQLKDPEIYTIKKQLENGQTESKSHKKYIILDDVLYYISNVDEDPVVRLYSPLT